MAVEQQQPKKPAGGGYGRFLKDKREEITKSLPVGHKMVDIAKAAGAMWKALPEAEKKPYEMRFKTAQEEYKTALEAFTGAGGVVTRKSKKDKAGKKQKKFKDLNAPKKPAGGAYGRFLADKREEIKKMLPADHKITDVSKKAGELWKALASDEKEKYEALYQTAKETYSKASEEYRASLPEQPAEEQTPDAKADRKRKAAEEKTPKEPKKPKEPKAPKEPKPTKIARKIATPMGKKRSEVVGVELAEDVIAKARTAGFEAALRNLALRPEVVASGKSADDLLQALKCSEGLVNPAKRALLGQ